MLWRILSGRPCRGGTTPACRAMASAFGLLIALAVVRAEVDQHGCGKLPDGVNVAPGYCTWVITQLSGPRSLAKDSAGDLVVMAGGILTKIHKALEQNRTVAEMSSDKTMLLNHAVLIDEQTSGGPYLYASSSVSVFRWRYTVGSMEKPPRPETVIIDIPDLGHSTRSLAMNKAGDLVVQCGSGGNIDVLPNRSLVRIFRRASLFGPLPLRYDEGEILVRGMRNEVGIGFDMNDKLWGVENGGDDLERDDLGGDIHDGNPCEEINLLSEDGAFYGYPYCWSEGKLAAEYAKGARTQWSWPDIDGAEAWSDATCRDTAKVTPPEYCMVAHAAPLGFKFHPKYNASLPYSFPDGHEGDMIVMQHGSWDRDPPSGYKVVRVRFDGPGGRPVKSDDVDVLVDGLTSVEEQAIRPVDGVFMDDGTFVYTSDYTNELLALRYISNHYVQPGSSNNDNQGAGGNSGGGSGQQNGDSSACFPANALVELEGGRETTMDQLQIGDRVRVGNDEFSRIFAFTHRDGASMRSFEEILLDDRRVLTLSPDHYMFIVGRRLQPAANVKVGDVLDDGASVVAKRRRLQRGLYHPHPLRDSIVVNGVQVSVFTTAVPPPLARLLLWPFKVAYRVFGASPLLVDSGVHELRWVPRAAVSTCAAVGKTLLRNNEE